MKNTPENYEHRENAILRAWHGIYSFGRANPCSRICKAMDCCPCHTTVALEGESAYDKKNGVVRSAEGRCVHAEKFSSWQPTHPFERCSQREDLEQSLLTSFGGGPAYETMRTSSGTSWTCATARSIASAIHPNLFPKTPPPTSVR